MYQHTFSALPTHVEHKKMILMTHLIILSLVADFLSNVHILINLRDLSLHDSLIFFYVSVPLMSSFLSAIL